MPKYAAKRLTDSNVKALKATGQRYEVFDAVVSGFGVRVSATGRKSWVVMDRINGKRKRVTICQCEQLSLAEARQRATGLRLAIKNNDFSALHDYSVIQALDIWYDREQKYNKSFNHVRISMKADVIPAIGHMQLRDVKKYHLLQILDKISARGANTQANRVRAFIKRFFAWSVERDYLEYSPAQHLPRAHTEPPRDRYLTLDEIKRLWSACKIEASHSGYILRLLLLTGQRVSEVSKATWDEFDLEHRVWRIPQERSKNKTSHEIYLADGTINILRELHTQRFSKFLFSNTGVTPFSGFSKAKRRVDEASGITNWRQHDLRRTFATHVSQELGVQPIVVDKILNHRSGVARGILGVYQRGEYLKERRDALVSWDTFLQDLIGRDAY